MAVADIRLKRAEQEIETLRSTQRAILDQCDRLYRIVEEIGNNQLRMEQDGGRPASVDRFGKTRKKTRDFAAEILSELNSSAELRASTVEISRQNNQILRAISTYNNISLEDPPHIMNSVRTTSWVVRMQLAL